MKVNPTKFQFMILGKTPRKLIILNINQIKVEESQKVVLLGLTIDNRLTFKDHIDMLCSTANYKPHAMRRIRNYLILEKTKLLYNAFINSQFNHVSVIWMFCRKKDYLKIEKIQYKALKIIVVNHMKNSLHVAMKCQFIKNNYVLWLQKSIEV